MMVFVSKRDWSGSRKGRDETGRLCGIPLEGSAGSGPSKERGKLKPVNRLCGFR